VITAAFVTGIVSFIVVPSTVDAVGVCVTIMSDDDGVVLSFLGTGVAVTGVEVKEEVMWIGSAVTGQGSGAEGVVFSFLETFFNPPVLGASLIPV